MSLYMQTRENYRSAFETTINIYLNSNSCLFHLGQFRGRHYNE